MAEIEVGGIKFKGGKILVVLTALSTAGGAMWGGFEFWKDYQDLQQTVSAYVAPDLSGFDKRIDVMRAETITIREEMESLRTRVLEIQEITRDTKQDVREDATQLYEHLGAVDKRSRATDIATREAMRIAEISLRVMIESASSRFDNKINGVDAKLDMAEKRQDKKLQRALDNPLLK